MRRADVVHPAWVKTFGYFEHIERECDSVNNVHSYHPRNEHFNDRVIQATHREGPMQRWQHAIYRPAHEYG